MFVVRDPDSQLPDAVAEALEKGPDAAAELAPVFNAAYDVGSAPHCDAVVNANPAAAAAQEVDDWPVHVPAYVALHSNTIELENETSRPV